jgi:hypothetical protein
MSKRETLPLEDPEEFANETRVVDFGQSAPPGAIRGGKSGDPIPDVIRVCFRTIRGPVEEQVTEMRKAIVMLGRVAGIADVVVPDEAASRYHASVTHRENRFVLNDMGSTNGTFVNRRRVSEVELKHGDQIRIGVTVLVFEIGPRT